MKTRWTRTLHLSLGLGAALLLLGATACDDAAGNGNTDACTVDDDCGMRGMICSDGECVTSTCVVRDDCGANRTCFQGACTAVECTSDSQCDAGVSCINLLCQDSTSATCSTDSDCAAFGKVCNPISGICVDGDSSCTSDDDCDATQACDTASGACVPRCTADTDCADTEFCSLESGACETGCREDGCAEGEVCSTETRECITTCTVSECAASGQACDPDTGECVDRTGGDLCSPCMANDECGGPGDRCQPFGDGRFCSFLCESAGDCPAGFNCIQISSSAMGCIPQGNTCSGCLVDGCAAGEACNPVDGMCGTQVATCEVCEEDWQCGDGSQCEVFQGRTRCLEECAADGSCSAGNTCNTQTGLCEPDTGACTDCTLDPGTCATGEVVDEDACECVECASNADCTDAGEICAQGVNECVTGTTACMSDADCSGGTCYGALPPERSGACVQCTTNANCTTAGQFCQDFVCQNCTCPLGEECDANGNCIVAGSCTTDQDCVDTQGPDYVCEPASQKCYIPGQCSLGDPTLAPCPSTSMCANGAIPGLPASCTCTAPLPLPFPQPSPDCRAGEQCLQLDASAPGACTALGF